MRSIELHGIVIFSGHCPVYQRLGRELPMTIEHIAGYNACVCCDAIIRKITIANAAIHKIVAQASLQGNGCPISPRRHFQQPVDGKPFTRQDSMALQIVFHSTGHCAVDAQPGILVEPHPGIETECLSQWKLIVHLQGHCGPDRN